MKLPIDFDVVIQSHSHWKYLLKNAIQQGHSEYTVTHAQDPHHCAFGKWLYSPAGKNLPDYLEIVEMHQLFHEEAAKVLELALLKQTNEAMDRLKLGSSFNQASAKLINKLTDVGEILKIGRKRG